MYLALEIKIIL